MWSRQPAGCQAHLVVVRDVNGFVGRRPEDARLPDGGDLLGGQQGEYWPLAYIHHDAALCHDTPTRKRTLLKQKKKHTQKSLSKRVFCVFINRQQRKFLCIEGKKTWSSEGKYSILYEICNCFSIHLGEKKASHWKNRFFS